MSAGVLRYTLVVRDEGGQPVALLEGQEVPEWARELVHADDLEGGDAADDSSAGVDYESKTKPELQAEIDKRNEGREDDAKIVADAPGNKPDLVKALAADDAAASA